MGKMVKATWYRNPPSVKAAGTPAQSEGNPALAERFTHALKRIPGVAFATRWFDADDMSYFLQHSSRTLASEPSSARC